MAFGNLFQKNKKSGSIAKDRLRLTIVSDRAGCSSEIMEKIRIDIIEVLSRYVEIDQDNLDIKITNERNADGGVSPQLSANIPIKDMRKK